MTTSELLDHRGRPRVAVTGIGATTPAGPTVEDLWATVEGAVATARTLPALVEAGCPVGFGSTVDDAWLTRLDEKQIRRMARASRLGVEAGLAAVEEARVVAPADRCAVVAGTGIGGLDAWEEQSAIFAARGAGRVSPFTVPMVMPNATGAHLSMLLGWTGPNPCVAMACAAGAYAVGEGVRLVRDGSADVVLAGGTESLLSPLTVNAFARTGAMSQGADGPERASRPFDAGRDGFVMGEGAAFLVLERLDLALARGARVLGEVTGFGRGCDAYHLVAPSPGGAGAAACMRLALADAGIEPTDVMHVNAHGTSTALNDSAEAAALRAVFGEGRVPPVTATKGATGHLIGASGAVEAVVALLAATRGLVPPTANLERLGEGLEVDVVSERPRPVPPGPALSNSFGFGGHNVSLVLAPPDRAAVGGAVGAGTAAAA